MEDKIPEFGIPRENEERRDVNRVAHATCFLVILKSTDLVPVHLEAHEKFSLAWVTSEEIFANWHAANQSKDYDHWIYFLEKCVKRVKEMENRKI
jgi:hypothetical protein